MTMTDKEIIDYFEANAWYNPHAVAPKYRYAVAPPGRSRPIHAKDTRRMHDDLRTIIREDEQRKEEQDES